MKAGGAFHSPIRPRPITPQVAGLLPLVANDLRDSIDTGPAAPLFLSMHVFDGEDRIITAALMIGLQPCHICVCGEAKAINRCIKNNN